MSLPEYEPHIVKAVDQSLYILSYPGQMFYDHEHSTTVTTIRRQNQRLPLESLSS